MSTEENRRIIIEMFEKWSTHGAGVFWETISDDILMTTIGTTKYSGTFVGKEQLVESFAPFQRLFEVPVKFTVDTVVADGDTVAVQARGHSRTRVGQDYNNVYAIFFRMADGKIAEYTEYFDTDLTNDIFGK
jgi:uncharacterized protein